jgi:hypothetical protein
MDILYENFKYHMPDTTQPETECLSSLRSIYTELFRDMLQWLSPAQRGGSIHGGFVMTHLPVAQMHDFMVQIFTNIGVPKLMPRSARMY